MVCGNVAEQADNSRSLVALPILFFFFTYLPRSTVLYDPLALRMSPNVASPQTDTQSLHYIIRSGLAGGIAGCVVSRFSLSLSRSDPGYRQRPSLLLLTESKSSFKPPTQTFRNMQVCFSSAWWCDIYIPMFIKGRGAVHSAQARKYTKRGDSEACSRAIPRRFFVFSPTRP
jgi:hypothetical protein